jgi:NAD(P)-dependent dehydrogenase (short-subunit alcohol dehydrogenase family)
MKKKILITGASSDIGISVVEKYIGDGWNVTAHFNKNSKELKKLKSLNDNLDLLCFDFKNIKKFEKFIKKNKSFFKKFDAFISLTGLNNSKQFNLLKINDINSHLNVNYFSGLLIVKEVVNSMKNKKWGRILLTSSIGTKFGGGKTTFAYSLSKYMNEFFPSVLKENIKHNVLYNCLRIGVTDTKIHQKVKNKNMKKRINLIPIKRMAKTKEITEYIYFLCSSKNTQISNEVLNISGGE